ncbi:MAG: hypothetical protein N7Q72_03645, partial [Spiroplasma sp. Tabriz.8]|nr:hypothetical protein [Spiroplasma sp. Tabriz.8]
NSHSIKYPLSWTSSTQNNTPETNLLWNSLSARAWSFFYFFIFFIFLYKLEAYICFICSLLLVCF